MNRDSKSLLQWIVIFRSLSQFVLSHMNIRSLDAYQHRIPLTISLLLRRLEFLASRCGRRIKMKLPNDFDLSNNKGCPQNPSKYWRAIKKGSCVDTEESMKRLPTFSLTRPIYGLSLWKTRSVLELSGKQPTLFSMKASETALLMHFEKNSWCLWCLECSTFHTSLSGSKFFLCLTAQQRE